MDSSNHAVPAVVGRRPVRNVWMCWCTLAAASGVLLAASAVTGQDRNRPAVFDVEAFFDQVFGEQTPEQRRALEQVEISWQEEQQFGRQALDRFLADLRRQNIRVVSRGKEVERLRRLVEKIRPQMEHADRYRSITVLVAESPESDARCFPGGNLVFFRGLLEEVPSESALVGVIGHELSHIDHGHQLRYLKAMRLAQRTFSAGRAAEPRNMMHDTLLLTRTFARPFRPEEELEADRDGVTWAYRAGYDPRDLAKLFLLFEERKGKPNAVLPAFLRTHPYDRQRYEAVLQRYEELVRTEPRGR